MQLQITKSNGSSFKELEVRFNDSKRGHRPSVRTPSCDNYACWYDKQKAMQFYKQFTHYCAKDRGFSGKGIQAKVAAILQLVAPQDIHSVAVVFVDLHCLEAQYLICCLQQPPRLRDPLNWRTVRQVMCWLIYPNGSIQVHISNLLRLFYINIIRDSKRFSFLPY